ncbi:hypothetical protein niasHS_013437 [Heterodera schachtii]|uniref:Translation factor GUF1 homolog, mitochondrial n=1 Tax=Heterodera schachtii TaxID=97005 RepID=A0ABD2IEZ9_HETSC
MRCRRGHKSLFLRFCSSVPCQGNQRSVDYSQRTLRPLLKYVPEKIRNFAIIAHVDHGKSTLADRFLQLTNVISAESDAQYLDKLEVERERGITIKAQTCSMFHKDFMLNLVDTPGHVDFGFEVKRSLITCDGAILLVAANEGIQAQTLFNFHSAFENNLSIIPVINKIDMEANIAKVEEELQQSFGFHADEIFKVSAKTGRNVPELLEAIIQRIPPPQVNQEGPCQAHVFDSCFDHFKGALLFVVVKQGILTKHLPIRFYSSPEKEYVVSEIGILHPETTPTNELYPGQMGYIYCGIKSSRDVLVGDTLFHATERIETVKPYVEIGTVKPTVYSGLFPMETTEYERLRNAVESLQLNDPSVILQMDSSVVFGQGWRVGFVGNLHMEVFGQRLEQEHGELAVFTSPSVKYLADIVDNEGIRKRRHKGQSQIEICKPSDFPEVPTDVLRFLEPMSLVSIVTPAEYFSNIERLCQNARGEVLETTYIDEKRMILRWRLPLVEIIVDFFDRLKLTTSGFASFDQKDDGYRDCRLEKICIFVNDKPIDELSALCPGVNAKAKAAEIVKKLADEIPQHQFEVMVKACLGTASKAVAQRKIKAMKKDFTGLLKGNMVADRLGKKLKHQREGKERLKLVGTLMLVDLDHLLSVRPVGLCLIEYASTLSPSFLFVHFISNFSKSSSADTSDHRITFVSLHTTLGLLRMVMGKMAQRLNLDAFHFVSVSDFLGDSLLFDCDRLFSWITEEVLRSVLPDRPQLVVLDDLFLSHPSIRPAKLLQFLLALFVRLPDRSFFIMATANATPLSAYISNFFNFHIRLTPIGDGLGKSITGKMEIFRRDLQRNSLPFRTLFHYHCGQRSAKTFSPGAKQLLI